MKIIDMYFWEIGREIAEKDRAKKNKRVETNKPNPNLTKKPYGRIKKLK